MQTDTELALLCLDRGLTTREAIQTNRIPQSLPRAIEDRMDPVLALISLGRDTLISRRYNEYAASPEGRAEAAKQAAKEATCVHVWEIISHEEACCQRCNAYRFVADVD